MVLKTSGFGLGGMVKISVSNLLQVPAGSSARFFGDAQRHRTLVRSLDTLFDSWGYLPVHTPLLDYASPYDALISKEDSNRIYHLIGRDGDVLMLRWDITLFLVKLLQGTLRDAKLPLRLSYADAILRHQDELDISRNETFQTGVELIGTPGPDADAEALLLLAQSMKVIGLDAVIHVGSREVFNLSSVGLSEPVRDELSQAIVLRDRETIKSLVPDKGSVLADCFSLITEAIDAPKAVSGLVKHLPDGTKPALESLAQLLTLSRELMPDARFRLDLSELGSQRYHSGIVFQSYAEGQDSAIAMGGRYDRLMSTLGFPQPAIGFSIMLSKISAKSADTTTIVAEKLDPSVGKNFKERFLKAQELRANGKRVQL